MGIFKRKHSETPKPKTNVKPRPQPGVRQRKYKVDRMHWAIKD